MIVAVSQNRPATLEEQDSFKCLKVMLGPAAAPDRALHLLEADDAAESDHLWIPASLLRNLATRSAEGDAAFDAMLAKVEPFGWYDAATGRVKAHVEHSA